MPLPAEAVAKLRQPHLIVDVGDVWWVPEQLARYPGGKDRYCLVVALETPPGIRVPTRAHYVAGSTRRCGPPLIIVQPGEATLPQRTHFGFWWSGDIDLATLVQAARFKGRLQAARQAEIILAIHASKRAVLKRLAR